jgi:tetratricopeptide (TPR) repeat protein
MSLFAIVSIGCLVALLILQGITLLTKPDQQRWHLWTGVLTLSIASVTALGCYLFGGQLLIIAPELSAALVQGKSVIWLRIFIVLYALAGGLLMQAGRAARGLAERGLPLVLLSLLVGLLALAFVNPVGHADDSSVVVYRYDLLSPVLLLWEMLCVLQWTLVVLGVQNTWFRFWLSALMTVSCSAVGAMYPEARFASAQTHTAWSVCLVLGIVVMPAVGLRTLVWKLYGVALAKRPLARLLLRLLWIGLGFATLLGVGYAATEIKDLHTYGIVSAIAAAIVLLLCIILMLARALRSQGVLVKGWHRSERVLGFALLAAFVVILLASLDITLLRLLPDSGNLAILALAAIVLVELTSEGPLQGVTPSLRSALFGDRSFVRVGVLASWRFVHGIASVLLRPLAWLWSFKSISGVVGKLVAAIVVLVTLSELPNRHKTLVRPLDTSGLAAADKPLGGELALRITHHISVLASELRSEVLVSAAKGSHDGSAFEMALVTDAQDGLRAAVQSDFIEISTLKIPLGLLLDPIQRSLEVSFDMRIVSGSLQRVGDRYHLLAMASTGQSWPIRDADAQKPAEVAQMGKRMAFDIISSDPRWIDAGMTGDWDAFNKYIDGLEDLRTYERLLPAEADVARRGWAISEFREAVAKDPRFALAQYRLGMALATDGEPAAAVDALRAAIAANSRFLRAHNALAQLLVHYDNALPRYLTAAAQPVSEPAQRARREEAEALWEHLVALDAGFASEYDRGSAYLGLCEMLLDDAASADHKHDVYEQAFYYCARAEQLYAALSPGNVPASDLLRTRASILNAMGVILMRDSLPAQDAKQAPPLSWDCNADLAKVVDGQLRFSLVASERRAQAARYFERAHLFGPDDSVVSCNLAQALDGALGSAMREELRRSPKSQLQLGRGLLERASAAPLEQASVFFRAAFDALQSAIDLDPENLEALNEYAYAYRVWRLHQPALDADERGSEQVATRAERYARKAVRLAPMRTNERYTSLVLSTLGEVLLARNRPHEAIESLEQALALLKQAHNQAAYDEVRWDLAQAYRCAEHEDEDENDARRSEGRGPTRRCQGLPQKMSELLTEIRNNESWREAQPFVVGDLEPAPSGCCDRATGTITEDAHVAAVIHYSSRTYCEPASNELTLRGDAGCAHVWGRGYDQWQALDAADDSIAIPVPELPTHGQYFVQLFAAGTNCEDTEHSARPLTPAYALETDPARCAIEIEFRDQRLADARQK